MFTDSDCVEELSTSDIEGSFYQITSGLALDSEDMFYTLNDKSCQSCAVEPYTSTSATSIFKTFHYEYYRQKANGKDEKYSQSWNPVSNLCSSLYTTSNMLRCEQDIPGEERSNELTPILRAYGATS